MPTLERQRYATSRPEISISTAQRGWQYEVARLIRQKERFVLETACSSFDPSGYTTPSVWSWVSGKKQQIAGCGFPAVMGVALLALSTLAPEPISRTLLALFGIAALLMVGRVIAAIVSARYYYHWRVSFNGERGTYLWIAEPAMRNF